MQKMEYCRPAADLILFENEDVIMTSKVCSYNPGWECSDSDNELECNGQLQWCGNQCYHMRNGGGGFTCSMLFKFAGYSYLDGQVDTRQYSGIETFDDFGEWRD